MARIFYSMAGEGRGHAVRVRTLVEHLRHEHELTLFAPDEAYELLDKAYGQQTPNVRLLRIPGLRFEYTHGRLDLTKSIRRGMQFSWSTLPRVIEALRREIAQEEPDLAISDFEPALPRAARFEHVPLMTIDHQHVLSSYDLSSLPWRLRHFAWWMGLLVPWYYLGENRVLTSSFFSPPLKRGHEHVTQIGPLIRPEVAQSQPTVGPWILSYLRTNTPASVLDLLAGLGCEIRVYGLGERPSQGGLTFKAISEEGFIRDLSGARAVISAAGNQLLGESLYLGKPVLAMPETTHHEQSINACFIEQMGVGRAVPLEQVSPEVLSQFLQQLPSYQLAAQRYQGRLNGTPQALAAIQEMLNRRNRKRRMRSYGFADSASDQSGQSPIPTQDQSSDVSGVLTLPNGNW